MKNFQHGSKQRNETFNDNEMSAKNNIIFHGSLACEDDLTININGTNFTISSIIERLAALESNSGGSSNTGSGNNQEDPALPAFSSITNISLSSDMVTLKSWQVNAGDSEMWYDLYVTMFSDFMRNSLSIERLSNTFYTLNTGLYIMGNVANCQNMSLTNVSDWHFGREEVSSRKHGTIKALGKYWQNIFSAGMVGCMNPETTLKVSDDGIFWRNANDDTSSMAAIAGSSTCLYGLEVTYDSSVPNSNTRFDFKASNDGTNWNVISNNVIDADPSAGWFLYLTTLYSNEIHCLNDHFLAFGYSTEQVGEEVFKGCSIYAYTHDGNASNPIKRTLVDSISTDKFNSELTSGLPCCAYGNEKYVVCLHSSGFYVSNDLNSWAKVNMPGYWFTAMSFYRGIFIVVGYDAPALTPDVEEGRAGGPTYFSNDLNGYTFTSVDGMTWTKRNLSTPSNDQNLLEYVADIFIYDGKLYTLDILATTFNIGSASGELGIRLAFRALQITE